jgi:uncharacterized RDD family membrane protein YckC
MNPHKAMGRRFIAFLIDGLILSAINSLLYFPFAEKQADILSNLEPGESASTFANFGDYSLTGSKAGLFFLGTFVVTILYWVVLVGRTGWSPGKAAVGLRVVRVEDSTTPPGMLRALLRHFLWIADMFPYLIPGLTGFIVAMTNPRRRRLGDLVGSTMVIRKEGVGNSGEQSSAPAQEYPQSTPFGSGPPQQGPPLGGPPLQSSPPVEEAAPPVRGTQAMPAITPASKPPEPPPLPAPSSGPPADWYPDPHGVKRLRYWDGTTWTDHTAD